MRNEDKYKGFPECQQITINEYQDIVMKSKKYLLIHLTKKESHQALPELMAKFENLYEYYEINCSRKKVKNFAREELDIEEFPSIIFIHAQNKEIIDIFNSRMSSYEIIARINELVRDSTYHIQHSEAKSYLDKISTQMIPTIIYFSKTEDDIGIIFKSLALLPQFHHKINFVRILDAPYQIMTLYQINRRNDILAIIGKKMQFLHFAEVFSVRNIFEFINQVINESNNKKEDL